MSGVTARARCRHGKSALHQSLAMDALRVVLNDFVLRADVPGGRLLSFTMTLCAQRGDIRRKRRRILIDFPEDVVSPVTLLAGRSVGVVLRHKLPMRASLELLTDFSVARRAIYFFRDRLAWTKM